MFRCPSKVVFLIGLLTLHHCLARPAEDVENKQKAPVENVKEGATDGKEQPSAFAKMQSPPQFVSLVDDNPKLIDFLARPSARVGECFASRCCAEVEGGLSLDMISVFLPSRPFMLTPQCHS